MACSILSVTVKLFSTRYLNSSGTSVFGPATRTVAPSFVKQMNVRARHARVQDVADDRDFQAVDSPFMFADGHRVEQRLRRMLMRAVAGVDDCRSANFRELMRHAGARMADDDAVGRHRIEIQRRVEQRFAFRDTRRRNADIDGIRRKTFGGEFETECASASKFRRKD